MLTAIKRGFRDVLNEIYPHNAGVIHHIMCLPWINPNAAKDLPPAECYDKFESKQEAIDYALKDLVWFEGMIDPIRTYQQERIKQENSPIACDYELVPRPELQKKNPNVEDDFEIVTLEVEHDDSDEYVDLMDYTTRKTREMRIKKGAMYHNYSIEICGGSTEIRAEITPV